MKNSYSKSKLIVALFVFFVSFPEGHAVAAAQASWLPEIKNANKRIRLLECTYNEAELKQSREISATAGWDVRMEQTDVNEGKTYTFTFTAKRDMKDAGVAVAFDQYGWTSDNYVMIPPYITETGSVLSTVNMQPDWTKRTIAGKTWH